MTLSDAEKRYNGFERPVAYFKINDAQLSGESLVYHDIQVTLSSGMEASDCTAEIVGQYSRFEEGGLKLDAALSKITLGAKLEVFLGYGKADKAESVFVGYISSIEMDLQGETTAMIVTAMDCKQFMMNSFRSLRKKDIKKYSEAVSDVLKNYSAVYTGTEVEASENILAPIEQHNQSDYDFVVSLAKRLNYLFYVVAGKVYFVSYKKYTNSVLTVEPGANLYRLRREVSLANQVKSVTVRSHNVEDADKPFESKATAVSAVGGGSKAGAESTKLINATMEKVVVDNAVRSEAEAKSRAAALMNELSMGFLTGSMELPGLPPVIPGRMVTVDKVNDDFNRDYFITKVVHHMDKDGFQTTVYFAGNKV